MKSEPYRQFIDRNSCDISDCIRLFHELNHLYDNQLILSLDSRHWEIFDLRTSRSIARIEFKHIKELRHFISTLIHDISTVGFHNSCYRGQKKLGRSAYCSIKRLLNLYGFDEYFITNRNLINYIIYGEINKE